MANQGPVRAVWAAEELQENPAFLEDENILGEPGVVRGGESEPYKWR